MILPPGLAVCRRPRLTSNVEPSWVELLFAAAGGAFIALSVVGGWWSVSLLALAAIALVDAPSVETVLSFSCWRKL